VASVRPLTYSRRKSTHFTKSSTTTMSIEAVEMLACHWQVAVYIHLLVIAFKQIIEI
jgi:hypothetical protein